MAVLLCLCGEPMGGSQVPCDSIVEIYTKEAIDAKIANNTDFVDLWDKNYTYWYCPRCKRLTITEDSTRHYYRSYSRIHENEHPSFEEVASWQEILFYRDREFYDAIEENDKIKVGEFVQKYPSRYLVRLSPDETKAFVFAPQDKAYLFTYVLDPKPDFEKLDGK